MLKPGLMKGGGPYPGGGIPMVTGKAGGTKPTPLGTAWATGSWRGRDESLESGPFFYNRGLFELTL